MFRSTPQEPNSTSDPLAKAASSEMTATLENVIDDPIENSPGTLEKTTCEAPMSPTQSSTTAPEALHDDDSFALSESSSHAVSAPLRPTVFFVYGPYDADYGGQPLFRAQSFEAESCGILRVVVEDPDKQTAYASVSELMIDARVHCDDEPRLSSFIGARVNKGRIERIFLDSNSSACCDVRRRCVLRGEEETLRIGLEQAVEEIRNLERQRQNANLETYQRQMCNTMMRNQRARYLGLSTQSCPF
jgi:hypothetical protein